MASKLEICAGSIQSALNAEAGGADRIELCDNLAEGGTTPSYGTVKALLKVLKIPILPIIRPRGGGFNYTDLEFEAMKSDVEIFRDLGCKGVVFGILQEDKSLDIQRCEIIAKLAGNMEMGFHRAFDECTDQEVALEKMIELGFVRILTSGSSERAIDATAKICTLNKSARERITIMPGAGINSENIEQILKETGCREFHGTAKGWDGLTEIAEVKKLRSKLNLVSG